MDLTMNEIIEGLKNYEKMKERDENDFLEKIDELRKRLNRLKKAFLNPLKEVLMDGRFPDGVIEQILDGRIEFEAFVSEQDFMEDPMNHMAMVVLRAKVVRR